jgi:hypothetical protein
MNSFPDPGQWELQLPQNTPRTLSGSIGTDLGMFSWGSTPALDIKWGKLWGNFGYVVGQEPGPNTH